MTKIVDTLELYKIIPGGKSSEEATIWAGELAKRLAESETVADQTLLQLAEKRAQAIAGELADRALISKDRVGFKAPEPNSDKDPPSAKLSLDSVQSEPTH